MTQITYDDFKLLDLRLAVVKQAEPIEGADRLLKLTLDVGKTADGGLGERVVVSGIKSAYTVESLLGKKVIYLANLAPRRLRGVMSEGMILAASDDDLIALLTVDESIKAGAQVG